MKNNKVTKLSPIQALTQGVIENKFIQKIHENTGSIKVDPNECMLWKFHDRNAIWLTKEKCKEIIDSIKRNGQKIPALIRMISNPNKNTPVKYEIIAGARRWYACSILGIQLHVNIIEANDKDCAILMHIENKDREDISDFERAISLKNQLNQSVFTTQDEMCKKYGFSKSYLSKTLKAAKIVDYDFLKKYLTDLTSISINKAILLNNALENRPQYEIIYNRVKNLSSKKISFSSFSAFVSELLSSIERSKKDKFTQSYKNKKGENVLVTKATKKKIVIEIDKQQLERNQNEVRDYLVKAFNELTS